MIADDDRELQDLYAAMLAGASMEIITASDGGEALEKLEVSAPDVVVVDIILDEMMGDELYRRIKADPKWSSIPIVIISVLTATTCQPLLDMDPTTIFLRKPFTRKQLLGAILSAVQASG